MEGPGWIWLMWLHGRADRLRDRVHVARPTPPLEREAADCHQSKQAAQQCEGDPEGRGLRLQLRGNERDHKADDPRREPDRQQGAGEQRHPEATIQHRLPVALAKSPDEGRSENRPVFGCIAIVEHDAVTADPAVQSDRVPRPAVDHGLESCPRLGGRAAAGEGHRLHDRSSPRSTVTAWPPSVTRSPASRTRITPPRGEAWYAVISARSRRSLQNGVSAQWAEPVTGSSGTPDRSEEHTSELQSQSNLVCRLLLEKKNKPTLSTTLT